MYQGDKLICKNGDLLNKGETYFFDHDDIWDEEIIYVKCKEGFIYFIPRDHFYTVKECRKLKLKKLNKL